MTIHYVSNLLFWFILIAFFTWDTTKSSKKLKISEENLKAQAIDGSGFKTVLGTEVIS